MITLKQTQKAKINQLVYAGKIDNVLAMLKLDITLAKLNQKLLQGEQTPTLKTYLQNKNF